MSMNIHLSAEIQGGFTLKTGKKIKSIISETFDCIQTPSVITDKIMCSHNKYQVYVDYILERFKDVKEEEFIYANDEDYLCGNEPIDIVYINTGERHIKELNEFIKTYKDWNIKWSKI